MHVLTTPSLERGADNYGWIISRWRGICGRSFFFFFSSRRRHTRLQGDWSSDVCSSDLPGDRSASLGNRQRKRQDSRRGDADDGQAPGEVRQRENRRKLQTGLTGFTRWKDRKSVV